MEYKTNEAKLKLVKEHEINVSRRIVNTKICYVCKKQFTPEYPNETLCSYDCYWRFKTE